MRFFYYYYSSENQFRNRLRELVISIFFSFSRYRVDLTVGLCECIAGQSGSVCKHQVVAAEYSIQPLPQQFASSCEQRRQLAFVA